MIKSVIFGTVLFFAAILVIVGTKIGIDKLIENLVFFTGPSVALAILTVTMFIFFAFFSARFFIWYHSEPQNESGKKSWALSPVQALNLLLGVACVVVILDSFETMLSLAAQINEGLFWLICPMFIILIFFSALQQGKLEKRSNQNRANWWRG